MSRRITITAANGDDMTSGLATFADIIGLHRAAQGRYSMLLVLGLYGGFKSGTLSPAKVVREIEALEGIGEPSQLKAPIKNKHPPLKGLWHKHYLEDGLAPLAINLQRGLAKHGIPYFKRKIADAEAAGEVRYVTEEDIREIASDVVSGNYSRLAEASRLSGEWIVFAEHQGSRYYLGLTTHDQEHHPAMRAQIDALCAQEFPFLAALLSAA